MPDARDILERMMDADTDLGQATREALEGMYWQLAGLLEQEGVAPADIKEFVRGALGYDDALELIDVIGICSGGAAKTVIPLNFTQAHTTFDCPG